LNYPTRGDESPISHLFHSLLRLPWRNFLGAQVRFCGTCQVIPSISPLAPPPPPFPSQRRVPLSPFFFSLILKPTPVTLPGSSPHRLFKGNQFSGAIHARTSFALTFFSPWTSKVGYIFSHVDCLVLLPKRLFSTLVPKSFFHFLISHMLTPVPEMATGLTVC